jgi:hypothetical protein
MLVKKRGLESVNYIVKLMYLMGVRECEFYRYIEFYR